MRRRALRPAARARSRSARARRPRRGARRRSVRIAASASPPAPVSSLHRRHADAVQAARHDPRERLEVVVDVDREAVRRDAARDVHADRGDLALAGPDAGVVGPLVGARAGVEPGVGERGDDRALDRAQVGDDVDDPHDRIADELTRAVVGELAAAVDVDDVDPAARGTKPRRAAARPPASGARACRPADARAAAACRGSRRPGAPRARAPAASSASRYSTMPSWQTHRAVILRVYERAAASHRRGAGDRARAGRSSSSRARRRSTSATGASTSCSPCGSRLLHREPQRARSLVDRGLRRAGAASSFFDPPSRGRRRTARGIGSRRCGR